MHKTTRPLSFITIAQLLTVATVSTLQADADDPISFCRDIAPVLQQRCLSCHGAQEAEGGYRVDSYSRAVQPGDSGFPGFVPKDFEESEALRRITARDVAERMPLDSEPLPDEQIALLRRWVAEGASFDGTDPQAKLVTVIPSPVHPDPPAAYPFAVPVMATAFLPDGMTLLAGGYHELTGWHAGSGRLIRRIQNVGQRVYAISLSPDSRLLAVGCGAPGRHGEARIFGTAEGILVATLGATSDVVLDVAFSPRGDRLATASADGTIRLFDTTGYVEETVLTSHSDWVRDISWNPDGTRLASASRDKTAKVFDADTGQLLMTYAGHNDPVYAVAFHPNGAEVYSSGADKHVHRWKVGDGKVVARVNVDTVVYQILSAEDALFLAGRDNTVRRWNAKTAKAIRSYTGHSDHAISVAFHLESRQIASGGLDGRILVWDADSGSLKSSFLAAPGLE